MQLARNIHIQFDNFRIYLPEIVWSIRLITTTSSGENNHMANTINKQMQNGLSDKKIKWTYNSFSVTVELLISMKLGIPSRSIS